MWSACLPAHLPTSLYLLECTWLLVQLYTCLHFWFFVRQYIYLFTCLLVHTCTRQSVSLPIYLSTCHIFYVFTILTVRLHNCLAAYLSTCLPGITTTLHVSLHFIFSTFLSFYVSTCLHVYMSAQMQLVFICIWINNSKYFLQKWFVYNLNKWFSVTKAKDKDNFMILVEHIK